MKSTYIRFIIVILPFISSCTQKREQPIEVISMNNTRSIDQLKKLALKGDTTAYDELEVALMNDKYKEEYLIYSMVMANKYRYPRAYFQVYYCLTSIFEHHSGLIDEKTKVLAIEYLKKGVELKECQSVKELGNLYMEGKYVPKDTILGKELEKEGRKLCGF